MERIRKGADAGEFAGSRRTAQAKAAATPQEGDLAASINSSPYMVAQRKRLQSLFGDAARLGGEELPQQGPAPAQRSGDEEAIQAKTGAPATGGNGPVVQAVIHKGTTTNSQCYVRAPTVLGKTRRQVWKMMDSDRHYSYDKETQTVTEIFEKENKKRKRTQFEVEHEERSKKAKHEKFKFSDRKKTHVTRIFKNSKKMLDRAKKTKGTFVYEVNREAEDIFSNKLDRKNEGEFRYTFKVSGVNFSVRIPNQKNVGSVQDVFALTHVSLRGTGGKSSYSSMVENDHYPTLEGGDDTTKGLMGVEALRKPEFIPGIMIKNQQVESGDMSKEDAINPEKFGSFELKGASGKERDAFDNQVMNSTVRMLDGMDKDDSLKKKIESDDQSDFENLCEGNCKVM